MLKRLTQSPPYNSGRFAGWSVNGQLYDANGDHVGYFRDKIAVRYDGEVVGEMYNEFIGYRTNVAYPIYPMSANYVGIAVAAYADYAGYSIAGWEDPHF
jgi:hypothetical protein